MCFFRFWNFEEFGQSKEWKENRGSSLEDRKNENRGFKEGDVLIIDKMHPHHFITEKDSLVVLPLHIFSSTGLENNHPMMQGTHHV